MPVRRGGGLPPYAASAHPSAATVTALLLSAAVTGGLGVLLCWLALRRGWRPRPLRLLLAGCLAAGGLCLLPHVGSADPESYAAYGREAAVGVNPYVADPSALAARGDPYGDIVEPPWRHTPSVYGPLATLEQDAAARLAPHDPRTAVWLLDLAGAVAFVLTAVILFAAAVDDERRRRVAVLWAVNPLLLWQLVAGAHIDVLEIALALGAVVAMRRSPFLAGLLAGAAVLIKLPAALVVAGIAWMLRASARRLLAFAAPVAAVVLGGYAAAGTHAFDQARTASRFVSRATPWRPLATVLDHAWGRPTARDFIGACAIVIGVGVIVVLARAVPEAARSMPAALLVTAYVLVTPYALPWYDGLAWALLAFVAASRLDLVVLAHTVVLSVAYVPGRAVPLPAGVRGLTDALRDVVSPTLLGVLVVALVLLGRRRAAAHLV